MSTPTAIPHTRPAELSTSEGTRERFASVLRDSSEDCTVALLGIPDDTGVSMNGGRTGAAGGPAALREALANYGTASPGAWDWPPVFDAGDVIPGASLAETHARVTDAAGALLDAGLLPIAIGGGHDLTYPFVRALAQRTSAPPVGVYFDAHLDVRDEEGSGMPFRRLVEDCGVRELHIHGFNAFANTREHVQWFNAHGGRMDPFGPDDEWPAGDLFVSFDMDVLDQAFAPGVSALNPCGMTPVEAEHWAHSAGRCPRVRCFDIMELAPQLDPLGRTPRVAAHVLLAFCRGVAERR